MRVTVKQKLLAIPEVFSLSDLHLVWGDLEIARDNFETSLDHEHTLPAIKNAGYSLTASCLIHYRRAFDQGGHRRAFVTKKIVRQCAPQLRDHHNHLLFLSNKHIAHSENEYEQCLVTVLVAEDEEGGATFHGLGLQASAIALLSKQDLARSIELIDALREKYIIPKIKTLEELVKSRCQSLTVAELKMLPDGLAPSGSSNPEVRRSWPHRGKY